MGVLEQAYNAAMEKPLLILEVFNEFFGEDRVDMQGFASFEKIKTLFKDVEVVSINDIRNVINVSTPAEKKFILVHFPHVRITNEYDKYTDVNHLYVKVCIDIDGKIRGKFALNRAEYSVLHFTNNYMHSHISSIPTYDFTQFQIPCTGSGPINSTICSLSRDFDIDLWRLFCLELDKFMQVESIAGTPYHRLEGLIEGGGASSYRIGSYLHIRNFNQLRIYIRAGVITYPKFAEFIKYVIDSDFLKFAYCNHQYVIAMSPEEYYIGISNLFIDWYNKQHALGKASFTKEELEACGMIFPVKFVGGQLLRSNSNTINYQRYVGSRICTFKGEPVLLTITGQRVNTDANDVIILAPELSDYILTKIYNVINLNYGKGNERTATHKEIRFL